MAENDAVTYRNGVMPSVVDCVLRATASGGAPAGALTLVDVVAVRPAGAPDPIANPGVIPETAVSATFPGVLGIATSVVFDEPGLAVADGTGPGVLPPAQPAMAATAKNIPIEMNRRCNCSTWLRSTAQGVWTSWLISRQAC